MPDLNSKGPDPKATPWWPVLAALPVLFGGLWLWWAARSGIPGLLVGALPGTLLLSTGLSNILWAGDARIFQFMTLGAILGFVLSIPAFLVFGPASASVLLVSSVLCFVAAGYLASGQEHIPPGVPEPRTGPGMSVKVAADEVSMCFIVLTTSPLMVGGRAHRVGAEVDEALVLFEERGWSRDPARYHQSPLPVEKIRHERQRYRDQEFERLSFQSAYEPWPEEPGRERWLSYEHNRTAYAWVLRHQKERPWLVCIPGIRMGSPRLDFGLFRPEYLHHELELNLLVPVLPIHGPRRVGPVSGDRILAGDLMDTLHAASQAMWDIRRLLAWLRVEEDNPAIGVLGHSLGGYAAALFACLDDELECVVAGNPAVDATRLFWRNALGPTARYLRTAGVQEEKMTALMKVVSPLVLEPRIPKEHLAIFGGVADRVVPPVEPHSLWLHWQKPRIAWYQGTHRGFLHHPEAKAVFLDTLRSCGMLDEG